MQYAQPSPSKPGDSPSAGKPLPFVRTQEELEAHADETARQIVASLNRVSAFRAPCARWPTSLFSGLLRARVEQARAELAASGASVPPGKRKPTFLDPSGRLVVRERTGAAI